MPPAVHALWAEYGGCIIFASSVSLLGRTENCQSEVWHALWILCFQAENASFSGMLSLHSYDACIVFWVQGASWINCRQKQGNTSFSPNEVFLFSRNSKERFGSLVLWYLWIGRAKHPVPGPPCHLAIEVLNVGGWLTHGDLAVDVGVDFLAVAEHRLIPARVRSEWARLKRKGLSSIWAPAS